MVMILRMRKVGFLPILLAAGVLLQPAHASATPPETAIGAASPISGSGEDLPETLQAKAKQIMRAQIRPLVTRRGAPGLALVQAMIEEAKAVSAPEAPQAGCRPLPPAHAPMRPLRLANRPPTPTDQPS